jgi:LPXTG-motif cell wall-anchored protein
MTFILRWPAILVLLLLVAMSLAPGLAVAATLLGAPVDLAAIHPSLPGFAANGTWVDAGLWLAAGVFFLVSAVRLIRRTQGFWTWLLGFACYGARWALAQQGDLMATVQSIDLSRYSQPAELAQTGETTEAQVALLGIILVVGLIVFIVDAADRAYWDKQGA